MTKTKITNSILNNNNKKRMGGKNTDRYIPYIASHKAYKNTTTTINLQFNDTKDSPSNSDSSSPIRLSSPEFFHDLRNTGHYQAIDASLSPNTTHPVGIDVTDDNGSTSANNNKKLKLDQQHKNVIAESLGFLNFKRVYTFTDNKDKIIQDSQSNDHFNSGESMTHMSPMSLFGKSDPHFERSSTPMKTNRPATRIKSHVPYRVLDAPNLRNDFYSNLICWSKITNNVIVGLGSNVYIWSDVQGAVQVMEHDYLGKHNDYVTCVSFCPFNSFFLVGSKQGRLILFNQDDFVGQFNNKTLKGEPLVEYKTSTYRGIGCIEWFQSLDDEYKFIIGEESGEITFFKIKIKSNVDKKMSDYDNNQPTQLNDNLDYSLNTTKLHDLNELSEEESSNNGKRLLYKINLIHKFRAQTQQICGISLNEKCNLIAVGGNDNSCSVWDIKDKKNPTLLQTLKHNAAVKAIAFCPWSRSLLATGGGSKDRTIKFWHAQSGTLVKKIKTKGQITSLIWSARYKQVVATFGFGDVENPVLLMLFSYPKLNPILQVKTPTPIRVLSAVASPDITSICIAANDETIRFYKLWDDYESEIKEVQEKGVYGSNLIEYIEGIDSSNCTSTIR
ncbi:hypothetical protein TPHA_0A05040 [Tetrapisispora phaffii CBS 4417]|uniref:Uncharacterized protein n=1 Tax=Tetrapisispora phaffii (strain ATCC 24235 / CBS 4417 / NBRC 1672 / NRRL Y-8282 / UCD 70-5) TaxID=1071381 RepID=G8BNV1_TETPH|nr:hypothetical protein TPHA_0A05040 [Tetrapisispora phaffii CBS 4417]CCE61579.1 hypothetical protein TPHA_0A05040 [Tetrapisispora phaffii CBS 4417]